MIAFRWCSVGQEVCALSPAFNWRATQTPVERALFPREVLYQVVAGIAEASLLRRTRVRRAPRGRWSRARARIA